jgi:beta-galactosidase
MILWRTAFAPLYLFLTVALSLAGGRVLTQAGDARSYVWLESEAPASVNVTPNVSGWGHPEFLSGEKWLQISIEADKVEKECPEGGVLLSYPFTLSVGGRQEIWDRIGYEFARSPFEWRVDSGAWATVSPEALTTDLMELQTWNEVAWLKLGELDLKEGPHTLDVRLPKARDAKGQWQRILYASDALCVSSQPFYPNSFHKPDDPGRTPQDEEAARQVFELPSSGDGGARVTLPLRGLWEVCRNDEDLPPSDVAVPMGDFPKHPYWSAISVPGDRNTQRPDLLFAHRLWYRTRVRMPEGSAGRSFQLVLPLNNLNTTVYVNGTYCGFGKDPYARLVVDVTKAMKPGVNEVWVGIRDAWYGYSNSPTDPMKLRKSFNLPLEFASHGFQDLAYPIWNAFRSGILFTPELVVGGPVYSADVFCKPSVARKEMAAEVTLTNTSDQPAAGEVLCALVNPKTGAAEGELPPQPFTLAPGASEAVAVAGPAPKARLWWPDDPQMTTLRTQVRVGGRIVDSQDTPFGFREWGSKDTQFTLNGITWPIWCDLVGSASGPAEWLAKYHKTNQRSMRLMGAAQGGIQWMGMTTDQALDWFDQQGVVVRRCGPLDGEAIGYNAIENDPELRKLYNSRIKMDLMRNWRDQMVAQVKGERNHPSIMLWSTENEWLYINCINLYGDLMDDFEREATLCSRAVLAVDPTRLLMTDGGGANKDQSIPVHGNHYVYGDQGASKYPQLAYEANPTGGGRGRWVWDQKRPRFIGEDYFATGIQPADYAIYGGEPCFLGKTEARPAAGLLYQILSSGYRWAGQSAWHFWLGDDNAAGDYTRYNAPRAVLHKQWDWSFGSGQKVDRQLRVYNNSHSEEPLTFSWTLTVGRTSAGSGSTTYKVAPGTYQPVTLSLRVPKVASRQEGVLGITLSAGGKPIFSDTKAVSVLPSPSVPRASLVGLGATDLLVYDPSGAVPAFLTRVGVGFTRLNSLEGLPASGRVLVLGRDALDSAHSTSSALAAWAARGRRVLALEQRNPLRYQAVPAEMEPSDATGSIAFGEDMDHPALAGLRQKDFFTWGPDGELYRSAYVKPTRGARSLVQCHDRLQNSALVEVPVGSGLMLLCQLEVGGKLAGNAVAQQLLCNLIGYAATYRQSFRPAAVVAAPGGGLAKAVDALGLQYAKVADPVAAITRPGTQLVVAEATPANLRALAARSADLARFTAAGGYLVLNGLTPQGLADYNKLVGFDHMIRPFTREKVSFPARRSPLTAGLATGDIVMLSGERIFGWTADEFVASDAFSYVVDLEDVAPFLKFPNDFAALMVNGFRNADAWKYIVNLPLKDADWSLTLPKLQTLTEVTWAPNENYNLATQFSLTFDGKQPQSFDLKPTTEVQSFPISPARQARELRVRITKVQEVPGKGETTGLDNLYLRAQRPADFSQRVHPLLNIGALVDYPRGKGGILLCNLLFKDSEAVPENAAKKRRVLGTLLRNLRAPFAGAKAVIAGADLRYQPLDLSKQANQYRDERGWFGDKAFTFKDLPKGLHAFAGVPFQIYEFPTSPVPTAVMLGGDGVPNNLAQEVRGIPVGRKADALFFLQAARLDQRRDQREIREKKQYEMARYVVHYADGGTAEVPLVAEVDVDDYRQKEPAALPGAQVAWTRPYAGTDLSAVAYLKQWTNPRPGVQIESVDLVYGKDRRGVPALLALTAASAEAAPKASARPVGRAGAGATRD